MISGWVKLYRKLWDNPRSSDPEWVSVWVYLLTHATHRSIRVTWKGETITLQPGQLITGRNRIAKATGVNASKIYRIIRMLEKEQQVEQRTSNTSSVISITNWQDYQESEQRVNSERTANEQQMNNKVNSKQTTTCGSQPASTQRLNGGENITDEQRMNNPPSKNRTAIEQRSNTNKKKEVRREEEEYPPTPQGGNGKGWNPSDLQIEVGSWFRRRPTTRWSDKELKSWKKLTIEVESIEFKVLQKYYRDKIDPENDYRRRDLATLLNNWPGEIDRAKRWYITSRSASRQNEGSSHIHPDNR
jgi:hypothetical protein